MDGVPDYDETSNLSSQTPGNILAKEEIVSNSFDDNVSNASIILLPQIIAGLIATGFHVLLGFSFAFSGIMVPDLLRNVTGNETDSGEIVASETDCAWTASVVNIITPVSAIIGGWVMDITGRLNMIKISAIPTIMGWVLIAMSPNVATIIAGRLLVGFGTIWGTIPAYVYITEISRKDMRGSLNTLSTVFVSLGMLLCYVKGLVWHWRIVSWSANAYIILLVALLILIPESPPWLVSKGRIREALKSLEWFNKYQPITSDCESFAQLELKNLRQEHNKKLESMMRNGIKNKLSKFRIFLKPTGYKPTIILCGLFLVQQSSGIYIIFFYSVTFLKTVGTQVDGYLASILLATVRLIMSCLGTCLLKYCRRRSVLMLSCAGMAVCMGFSGLITHWIKIGKFTNNWVPVLLILLFDVVSMAGMAPIPWTMTAELYPIEIRGIGHSLLSSVAYILMFVAVQSYWVLDDLCGGSSGIQYLFSIVSTIGLVYVFVFIPETHGKTLNDISEYFNHNIIFLGSEKRNKVSYSDNYKITEVLND